jgi:hypothetical protein
MDDLKDFETKKELRCQSMIYLKGDDSYEKPHVLNDDERF